MSLFSFDKIDGPVFKESVAGPHPEGKFDGTIVKVEPSKTQAGHRVINVTIKTEAGTIRYGINMDHPKCVKVSEQTIAQILSSYQEPPRSIQTMEAMVDALGGLPVKIFVKHKGVNDKGYTQYGVYFNEMPEELKVKFSGGAPQRRVEY